MKIYNLLKFQEIYQILNDIQFPINTTYKISRIKKYAEEELQFYFQQLQKIIEEYGEKDENGKYILSDEQSSIKIQPTRISECTAKLHELEQLEIPDIDIKLSIDELNNINMTPSDFESLLPFIK